MQRQYIVIGAERGSSMMGVHFRPGGAAPFFGFPISELTGAVIELDLIWKAELESLRDRLLEAADPSGKFDILEGYLRSRAANLEAEGMVDAAVAALRHWPALPIRELATKLGVSQKRMISRFDCRVGCTPKLMSRIFRFQQALQTAHQGEAQDWANFALDCGYYDQAHLIHEFQEFAGMTAADYARRRTEYPDYIYLD